MNGRIRTTLASTLLAAAALTASVQATPTITNEQQTPHHYSDSWDVSTYLGNYTQDDLNEATLDYSDLLTQLANLDHNVATYSNDGDSSNNLPDFITGAQNDGLLGTSVGTLYGGDFGWYANLQDDGVIDVTADWLIPGVTFRRWLNDEKKEIELEIADELVGDYNLAPDPNRILPEMVSAQRTAMNVYHADGYAVDVVPEPSSAMILGGLASLVATRRRF